MPITTGTVLGRYRLLEKAGVGGMSEVFKAEDETLKRIVAVKVILGPVAADSTFRERFLREARLVAGLEHPNVLPVFDYGTATIDGEEVSYLVMPLVAGGSLKGRVAGPVPPALAITWLSAIAAALDHAHSKGILHRDVKPGNVLMDAQGRPLLADFGLARSAEVSSGLTATGTVLGTPLYMAPEQAMGATLDGRADQYALAVIAFELLAGPVPFPAESPLAAPHHHASPARDSPPGHGRLRRRGALPRPREKAGRPVRIVQRVRRGPRGGARRSGRGGHGATGHARRVAGGDDHLRSRALTRGARRARVPCEKRAGRRPEGRDARREGPPRGPAAPERGGRSGPAPARDGAPVRVEQRPGNGNAGTRGGIRFDERRRTRHVRDFFEGE